MGSSTKAIRRAVERMFRELGARILNERGHRGHLRYEIELEGRRLDINVPGSPSSLEVCISETRRKVQRKLREAIEQGKKLNG